MVEPKFNVGDWIAADRACLTTPLHIKDVNNDVYKVEYTYGSIGVIPIVFLDRRYHLWTIRDAKNGDVLIDKSGSREGPFIFKETKPSNIKTDCLNPLTVLGYCGIGGAGFTKGSGCGDTANCTYYPATKEQRETLERAITNAGYRWDKEKLKLEKI